MIKGCQKRIIHLKKIHSDIFEEAYFIIKTSSSYPADKEDVLIDEAKRILIDSTSDEESRRKQNFKRALKRWLIPFIIGISTGACLSFLLFLAIF